MAKEWKVECKDCGKEFGYSDSSYLAGASRGLSRPERCPDCRKLHNRQTRAMGLAYFSLKPRNNSDTAAIHEGQLGAISHEQRIHSVYELPSSFDPNKFGITDDDVRAIFDWLGDPNHQVVVVEGPTGSGKSTVLPYKLISPPDGIAQDQFTRHGQIVVTQPRIQATRNIPAYVAKELYGSSLGSGFDIGFRYSNNPASDWRNKLVYVTDGTLINWIVNGQIANLSVIMIDEAHERSLNIDLILGLLKKLLPRYPYLKLIIASATIDADLFIDYFGREKTGHVKFRGIQKHLVKEFYRFDEKKAEQDSDEYCPGDGCSSLPYDDVSRIRNVAPREIANVVTWLLDSITRGDKQPGDILAFLQGEKPIQDAAAFIRQYIENDPALANVYVCPLYTSLPQEDQNKALLPKSDPNMRRVVITTNVAETSLTVEDIIYVVDSGLINEAQWDPQSQTKQVVPVLQSRAGCKQRWGRAGRITDGEAYCLYTKEQFNSLFPAYTVPQIQRSPLEQIVLTAKAAGIDDIEDFDWIQRPPIEELKRAPRVLTKKGALDEEGDLTEHGLELQTFSEEPSLANLMIVADRFCCAVEMATLMPMLKIGGLQHFLKWDRGWDAETRRSVRRIHESLMKSCRDDIEFCFKLFVAWSETVYEEQPLDPEWSFNEVWPRYIPQLPEQVTSYWDDKDIAQFKQAVQNVTCYNDLADVVTMYAFESEIENWLDDAYRAMQRASREAWAKAFYINHSLFRDKIEPERRKLLEDLSGHRKDDWIRPVDFSLIDRVRLILAYCLPERICQITSDTYVDDSPEEDRVTSPIYKLRGIGVSDEVAEHQAQMPVQINRDSVLYGKQAELVVGCKQQVITHRLNPSSPPEPVIHSSFVSLVEPEWLSWFENGNPSHIALGRYITRKTRDNSGELLAKDTYHRLFIDLKFPIGSAYECRVTANIDDSLVQVLPLKRLSDLPHVYEDYRREEPEVDAEAEVDDGEVGESDLPDTILRGMPAPVQNPEEEVVPSWVDLADDTYDIDVTSGAVENYDQEHTTNSKHSRVVLNDVEVVVSGRVPNCQLVTNGNRYAESDVLIAKVIDYNFSDTSSPVLIFSPVPDPEPITVFVENYAEIGCRVPLEVVGYDARPGDYQLAMICREPVSGLEVLLETDQITFSNRGFVGNEIPVGTRLEGIVENIDRERGRVHLSLLPIVEEHLSTILNQRRTREERYRVNGFVNKIIRDRVYLVLEWSNPDSGIIHIVSVGGKGLYKPADAYAIGEPCQMSLELQKSPSHVKCAFLPEEISAIIDKQNVFNNLSWANGELYFSGRMKANLKSELKAFSEDRSYRRAIDDLHRLSNEFFVTLLDTTWQERVPPIGTRISDARVLRIVDFGIFVDIGHGLEGLVHRSEISWTESPNPEDVVSVDEIVEVIIIKVDSEKQEIGLTMRLPEHAPDFTKYRVGENHSGKVRNVREFGAFVEIAPGISGLVHKSEMWGRISDATQVIDVDTEVVVKILDIDVEARKLSLSMKIPENNPLLRYQIGDRVKGKVTNVAEYGVFVELQPGASGLLHKSKLKGSLAEGDTVEVRIDKIDLDKHQLSFSM